MIPDVSEKLTWLAAHPQALETILRGVERETLRVTERGELALTPHPQELGSALTHQWITTDFAESLLEFVTPVADNVSALMTFLYDIHSYAERGIDNELLWPLSMPCAISEAENIQVAQYGNSNLGKMKTLYRTGLKHRYGAPMQIIAGVHYNFSLPLKFWQLSDSITDLNSGKAIISQGYLRLIRNYYRFGWVIPFLFGASPVMDRSFISNKESRNQFETLPDGSLYLPYATSLRMSDLGYTSKAQSQLGITFNTLPDYIQAIKQATKIPSSEFAKLVTNTPGVYQQLNSNILQIENEFYAPIRPKRVIQGGESPSDALLRGGIEYVEVRVLDVNPFSPVGIDAEQIRFLDLFLIWCLLAEAPDMSSEELTCARANWNRVILAGRKPNQSIDIGCHETRKPLAEIGKALFTDLLRVAEVLDGYSGNTDYQHVCQKLVVCFDEPELTLSGRMLQAVKDMGLESFALSLAKQYKQMLLAKPKDQLDEEQFSREVIASRQRQQALEANDTLSFDDYLAKYAR